jgi:hypothetical protein
MGNVGGRKLEKVGDRVKGIGYKMGFGMFTTLEACLGFFDWEKTSLRRNPNPNEVTIGK